MQQVGISKEEHFARLRQTADATWPVLESLVAEQVQHYHVTDILPHLDVFLKRRRGKPLLRPYLTRVAYETVGGRDWESIVYVLAAAELLNISTYQSNSCFDEKNSDWENTSAANQFIAAMVSLSVAFHAIDIQPGLSDCSKNHIKRLLSTSNEEVYLGQFLDLNTLSISNLDFYISRNDDVFIKDYVHRCRLIGGSMITLCLMGAFAIEPCHSAIPDLAGLFESFGIGGQMINDLADFFPTGDRPYTSSYGDLCMGRLTLPTFILARSNHPVITTPNLMTRHDRFDLFGSATECLRSKHIAASVSALIRENSWKAIESSLDALATSLPFEQCRALFFARHYMFENKVLRYFSDQINDHSREG